MNGRVSRAMELDCVRGLAILLAMGWHLHGQSGFLPLDLALAPGRLVGWAGVDLFFVLSGFLVGRLMLVELGETGRFDLRRFVLRRILRLWPVLYLYLAAQLLAGSKPAGSFFWQVMIHLQNYYPTPLAGLWSLAIEEHFYLVAGRGWTAIRFKRGHISGRMRSHVACSWRSPRPTGPTSFNVCSGPRPPSSPWSSSWRAPSRRCTVRRSATPSATPWPWPAPRHFCSRPVAGGGRLRSIRLPERWHFWAAVPIRSTSGMSLWRTRRHGLRHGWGSTTPVWSCRCSTPWPSPADM